MNAQYLAPQAWEAKFRCVGINRGRRSRCRVVFTKAWSTLEPLGLLDFYCYRHQRHAATHWQKMSRQHLLPLTKNISDHSEVEEQTRNDAAPLCDSPDGVSVKEEPTEKRDTNWSLEQGQQQPDYILREQLAQDFEMDKMVSEQGSPAHRSSAKRKRRIIYSKPSKALSSPHQEAATPFIFVPIIQFKQTGMQPVGHQWPIPPVLLPPSTPPTPPLAPCLPIEQFQDRPISESHQLIQT